MYSRTLVSWHRTGTSRLAADARSTWDCMDCPCARSRSRYGVSLLWLPRHLPNKTLFLCQQWVALHWSVFLFSPMRQQCSRPGGWGWWQRWRRTRGQVIRLKEQRAIQWFCWPLLINIGCHGNRQITSSYKMIVIKRPHAGKIPVPTL